MNTARQIVGNGMGWVMLLTLITHMIAVVSTLSSQTHVDAIDTPSYEVIAQNLVTHGVYSADAQPPYLFPAYRLPLLPLLMAASLRLSGSPYSYIYLVPFVAAFAAFAIIRIAQYIQPRSGVIPGILLAVYPGSLTQVGMALTDALGGYLLIIAIWAIIVVLKQPQKRWAIVIAAVFLLLGQLLRPVATFSGLFVVLLAIVLCRRRDQLIRAALLILLTIPVPLILALNVYHDYGVLDTNLLGTRALALYLMPQIRAGFDAEMTLRIYEERRERDVEIQRETPPNQMVRAVYEEDQRFIDETVHEYDYLAVMLGILHEVRTLLASQPGYLPGYVSLWQHAVALIFWWIILALAFVETILSSLRRRFLPIVLMLISVYFLVTAALSAWQGGRLRFPADILLIPIAGALLARFRLAIRSQSIPEQEVKGAV